MYAIIQDGGHQYRVEPGQRIRVQVRAAAVGDSVTFDQVCLLGGDGAAQVGAPFVPGARVAAKVTRSVAPGPKLEIMFYHRRKGYRRHVGHRQRFTEVEITGIGG